MDIETKAIELARTPNPVACGECGEDMYSIMDKLSIGLYGACTVHMDEDDEEKRDRLFTLISEHF